MMDPIGNYKMVQMYQEERRRQAEKERMVHAMKISQGHQQGRLFHSFVLWLGTHLMRWGQKLTQFGSLKPVFPLTNSHQLTTGDLY